MNSTPYKKRWLITGKKSIKIRILSGVQRNIYIYTHVLSSWEQLFKVVHLWFLKSTFCFQTQFYNEDEFNSIWKRWLIIGNKYIILQKRLLFATKLFRRPQNAIGKTSFFDGKSLSSTITRQILKHLWQQNKFVENAYYFCRKYDLFWREVFPPYFLRRHKNVHC